MLDVINKDIKVANEILKEYNLDITIDYKYDDNIEKDKIISQSIDNGVEIKEHDELNLVVSLGKLDKEKLKEDGIDELGKVPIMMYHGIKNMTNSQTQYTGGNVDKDGYNRTSKAFRDDLEFFYNNGYRFIRLCDYINGVIDVELGFSPIILTFDDGYIDNYTVALPLLKKYGFQGSFFIPGKTFVEHKLLDVNKIHFILAVVEKDGDISALSKEILNMIDDYRSSYAIEDNETLYQKYAIANRFDGKDTVFCKRILQMGIPEVVRNEISSRLFKKYVGIKEDVFAGQLYMNREQIAFMRNEGMFIGIHGYDHYWLGNLEKDKMEADIRASLSALNVEKRS